MLVGAGEFRKEAVRHEELWKIARNAHCSPMDRAAAAIALSAKEQDDANWQELLATWASPPLRRIFEKVRLDVGEQALVDGSDEIRQQQRKLASP